MTREELIKKVALKMDEISSSDDVIAPVDMDDINPLYTQINNLLNESINDVLIKAPIFRIQTHITTINGVFYEENVFKGDSQRKVAVIKLPTDFMKLVSISDTLFQRTIVDVAIEGDDIDKKQHNKFLVAKYAKPVAVLGHNISGERTITCYSYSTKDTPSPYLSYIKRYNKDLDLYAETDIDEYLTDIVSWACAGKVFTTHGDSARAKVCDENAMSLML